MKPEELLRLAVEAMGRAYVPYSGYQVGAALLCADGTVYQGCNIENASYTPHHLRRTQCIFQGRLRWKTGIFRHCGGGRQEWGDFRHLPAMRGVPSGDAGILPGRFLYLHGRGRGAYETYTLAELLPCSFSAAEHMK